MKMKEITTKSVNELNNLLVEKREALRVFRFGGAGSKTKNVKQGRTLKREIARVLTAINSKKALQ
jgi:ribosomal protein L29